MSVLVLGRAGQVGRRLMEALEERGLSPVGLGREELDITRAADVRDAVRRVAPTFVVNAAAYTAVDRAETEPERAAAVNGDGPAHVAAACAEAGAALLHISTDYVFDGEKEGAYREDDATRPLGVYGATKLVGEEAVRERLERHFVLRTAWVYSALGPNFVTTMLRLGRERSEIEVVADQVGSPTAARDFTDAVVRLIEASSSPGFCGWGTYHYCGAGTVTWHGFAEAVFELARDRMTLRVERVRPIASADYPARARRPRNSVLDCSKIRDTFGIRPRPWRESLAGTVAEIAGRAGEADE